MTEVSEGMMFELTATHKLLPKLVWVVQVKNDKAWLVDDPRTLPMPRYLRTSELLENYREVKNS